MTDPTPNDLCPQGEHAPGPKPLSPAAEAVLDAALPHQVHRYAAAAAIRAAVMTCSYQDSFYGLCVNPNDLLTIATELEGQ